jgi:hypothetical protein
LWGDEYPVGVTAPLVATSAEVRILGLCFIRFGEPVEWDGPFQSLPLYRNWLQSQGYLVSLERFARIPLTML